MSCPGITVMLLALGPTVLLIAGERPQDKQKAGPATKVHSDPVLRNDDDAKAIISKAVKAHGGDRASSRWKCGYLKYKTKGGVVPAQLGEVIVEDTFQFPGHFKRVTHIDARGRELLIIYVINHGKGWTKKGVGPSEPME